MFHDIRRSLKLFPRYRDPLRFFSFDNHRRFELSDHEFTPAARPTAGGIIEEEKRREAARTKLSGPLLFLLIRNANGDGWNTQAFFEKAAASDLTRCLEEFGAEVNAWGVRTKRRLASALLPLPAHGVEAARTALSLQQVDPNRVRAVAAARVGKRYRPPRGVEAARHGGCTHGETVPEPSRSFRTSV